MGDNTVNGNDTKATLKHVGEKFYAFHNGRLYDKDGNQVASVQDPVFTSFDITEPVLERTREEEIKRLNCEMAKAFGFSNAIIAEENGRTYAVFQMFDDERTAFAYLKTSLEELWGKDAAKDTFGIFEKVTENYEAEVETLDGIVKMTGRYVDNYYLKRTKGAENTPVKCVI